MQISLYKSFFVPFSKRKDFKSLAVALASFLERAHGPVCPIQLGYSLRHRGQA